MSTIHIPTAKLSLMVTLSAVCSPGGERRPLADPLVDGKGSLRNDNDLEECLGRELSSLNVQYVELEIRLSKGFLQKGSINIAMNGDDAARVVANVRRIWNCQVPAQFQAQRWEGNRNYDDGSAVTFNALPAFLQMEQAQIGEMFRDGRNFDALESALSPEEQRQSQIAPFCITVEEDDLLDLACLLCDMDESREAVLFVGDIPAPAWDDFCGTARKLLALRDLLDKEFGAPASEKQMGRQAFLALPENVRGANRNLAGLDAQVGEIAAHDGLSPLKSLRDLGRIDRATEYKRLLLSMGATQEGADFVRRWIDFGAAVASLHKAELIDLLTRHLGVSVAEERGIDDLRTQVTEALAEQRIPETALLQDAETRSKQAPGRVSRCRP